MNIIEPAIVPVFATPVMKFNMNREFTKDESQLLLSDIPMWKDDKRGMVNHRSKDLYLLDNFIDKLKDIKNFCADKLKDYLEEIEGIDTDIITLRITQSWLNKTKPQEQHLPHDHPNSYLSGVFYISCLPNDHINFTYKLYGSYNTINMDFPKRKNTVWNTPSLKLDVTEGDFIIFPSWLPHSVNMNNTKDIERISLSFNTFPIGELGKYNHGTHLIL